MSRFATILRTRKTQLALAVLLVIGFSLIPVHGANAACPLPDWMCDATGLVTGIFNAVLYFIIQILGLFLAGIATLADKFMQPIPLTTDTIVQQAWGITRDFANMFFILILLGIALDYILFNSFKVKQMIPRLIFVALLINFSLPIAGVLIDFANVFTQFFLSQASGNAGLSGALAQSLSLSHILDAVNNNGTGQGFLSSQNNLFGTLVFAILFMFGTAFVFLVLALMFLVRTGYLYVLLSTLPLVLVLSAFPPTAGHFRSWTNSFIKWTMFAPIATFFLWFAMLMFNKLIGGNIVTQSTFIDSLYKYVIVWVFLLGALMAAQSMGGKAAGMAMGAAGWVKGKTLRGLKRGGTAGLTAAGRGLKADERMESVASGLQKMGLGILAGGVRSTAAKTKMAMEKREELSAQKKAELGALPESALASEQERYEKSMVPGSAAAAAHIAAMRAKKGKLKVLDRNGEIDQKATEALVRSSYEAAKKHQNKAAMDAILQSNPLVARVIRQEEWTKDAQEGKVAGAVMDIKTHQIVSGKNIKTGKTFEDAQKDVFDISRADFENLKGQWNEGSVGAFIESGHLTRAHLRSAEEISDGNFTTFVREYYAKIDTMPADQKKADAIANIKRLNPALTNAYIAGNLTEVGLGKPKDAEEWLSKGGEQSTAKQTTQGRFTV